MILQGRPRGPGFAHADAHGRPASWVTQVVGTVTTSLSLPCLSLDTGFLSREGKAWEGRQFTPLSHLQYLQVT